MLSLIITVISFVIVAGLAMVILRSGGVGVSAPNSPTVTSVTRLLNEANQLTQANEQYNNDNGVYAPSIPALIEGGYLPATPPASPVSTFANNPVITPTGWVLVAPGVNVFIALQPLAENCAALNASIYKQSGILRSAHGAYYAQCYGPDLFSLMTVVAGNGDELQYAATVSDAIVALGPVSAEPLPAVKLLGKVSPEWLQAPDIHMNTIERPGATGPNVINEVAFSAVSVFTPDTLAGGAPYYTGEVTSQGRLLFTNHTGDMLVYGAGAAAIQAGAYRICTAGATCVVPSDELGAGTADWPYAAGADAQVLSIWPIPDFPKNNHNFNLLLTVPKAPTAH